MTISKKLYLALCLIANISCIRAEPEGDNAIAGTLVATDSKNINRFSRPGGKLVMVKYKADNREAIVKANPAKVPQEQGFPIWEGIGLLNPQNGALSVKYSGAESSEISASFSPSGNASVSIEIIEEQPVVTEINLDKYKEIINKINSGLDKIAKRADGINPVSVEGKVSYRTSKTDLFANGENIGVATGFSGDFSVKLAALKAKSADLPTPWPGLSIALGAESPGLSLSVKGDLKYDEQYPNPWIASSIAITAGSGVGISAQATLGPNFAGKASGLAIEGNAEFKLEFKGKIEGKGRSIVSSGNGELGALTLDYRISAKLDAWGVSADWEIYKDQKVVSEGEKFPLKEYLLVSW